MTPRENLRAAVEFRRPERLPINGYGEATDMVWIGAAEVRPPQAEGDPALDQWLCRWDHTALPNMGQVKGHPLADLAGLDDYPWPDGRDPRRFANVEAQLQAIDQDGRRDKYRVTSIFMLLWERMQALHGFEPCLLAMLDDDPRIGELADRLVDYDLAFIESMHRLAGNRIDAFSFTEDWGTETDLMVSPELFTRFFVPRYRRIFGAARDCGWHVWMHSCGKVNKAVGPLIKAGVQVLNLQQPRTNGIEELGRQFAGKVAFETLCDIQKTLPEGNLDAIAAEAGQLMRSWGTPEGGFVLGDYGDHVAIGARPDVKAVMLAEFRRQDPWAGGWDR